MLNLGLTGSVRVKLEDVCDRDTSSYSQKDLEGLDGIYPVFGASGFIKNINTYHYEKPYVAVIKDGAGIGRTMYLPGCSSVIGTLQYLIPRDNIETKFLYYAVKSMHLERYYTGATIPHIYFKDYKKETFNLPPKENQKHIIRLFESIENIINNYKKQLELLDNLIKSRFDEMMKDAEKEVRLDELIVPYKAEKCGNRIYPVLSITMHNGLMLQSDRFKKEIASGDKSQYKVVPRNKLVVAFPIDEGLLSVQDVVDVGIVSPAYSLYSINDSKVMPKVLEYILRSDKAIQYYLSKLRGTTLRRRMIARDDFYSMPIQLSSINKQKQFLRFVDQTDKSKVAIQKSLEEMQTLFDSLMQEYFG